MFNWKKKQEWLVGEERKQILLAQSEGKEWMVEGGGGDKRKDKSNKKKKLWEASREGKREYGKMLS